jgi:hypothetical protein
MAFIWWMLFVIIFMLGRLSANAGSDDEAILANDYVESLNTWDSTVTAEEEYLLQLKFAEDQKKAVEAHYVAPERWVSVIAGRLRYEDQHTTFNRELPQEYDYTVGWDLIDPIVNYAIHATKDLPHPNGGLMWLDLVKTWSLENSRFSVVQQWPADERGICQLRYVYHKSFMDSQEFFDAYAQIDYCTDIYLDRYNRTHIKWQKITNVRSTWANRQLASERFNKL